MSHSQGCATPESKSANNLNETSLQSLLDELSALIPAEREHHDKLKPGAAAISFSYPHFQAIIDDHKTYSINAACALYNAIRLLKDKNIFAKTDIKELLKDKKLADLLKELDEVKKHLWTLDSHFYPVFEMKKVASFVPFEIIKWNEDKFIVSKTSGSNPALVVHETNIKMGKIQKSKMTVSYSIDGKDKTKELSVSLDHSWTVYIVNPLTKKIAEILIKFAEFIKKSSIFNSETTKKIGIVDGLIAKAIVENFTAMLQVIEHILPQRIQFYDNHPEHFPAQKLKQSDDKPKKSTTAQLHPIIPVTRSSSSSNIEDVKEKTPPDFPQLVVASSPSQSHDDVPDTNRRLSLT